MIPRIEDRLVDELERRIVAAVPETAPGDGTTPETFITTIESRTVVPNVQEQNNLTIFCNVTAEISVIFYSQKIRYDYSALLADFASHPFVNLGEACAKVRIEKSEAVEGPYLSNDAWLFRAEYPVFSVEPGHAWLTPNIASVTVGTPDLYPRALPDTTNEPEAQGLRPLPRQGTSPLDPF